MKIEKINTHTTKKRKIGLHKYTPQQAFSKVYLVRSRYIPTPLCLMGMRVRLVPVLDFNTEFSETLNTQFDRIQRDSKNLSENKRYSIGREDMRQDVLIELNKCKTLEELKERLKDVDRL